MSDRKIAPYGSWKSPITSDLIVGFPGETDAEFEATLALMEQVVFDGLFSFKYSSRPGTRATELPDPVPDPVKEERLARLQQLQGEHTLRLLQFGLAAEHRDHAHEQCDPAHAAEAEADLLRLSRHSIPLLVNSLFVVGPRF